MVDAEQRLRENLEKIAKEQKYENHEIKFKPVNSDGANYTSRLFVVTISAPGKQDLNLFAKVATIGEKIRALSQTPMFEVETLFYTKILTKFRELEQRFGLPDDERLTFAKYYGGSIEYMKEMLVLEDLTCQGYRPFDRLKCYDWEYASQCVGFLARLHALSVAYEKDDPDDYDKLSKILSFSLVLDHDLMKFHGKCIKTSVYATDEKYKKRVEEFIERHVEEKKILKYYKPERIMLWHHGDFRPSNILQTTDKDGNSKLALVDHQLIQRGNPIHDLLFFLTSGSDEDFRAKHLHQFFDLYYQELRKALARFQIDVDEIYKKQDYEEDVKELLPFGLTLGALTLPIITVDASKAPKPEDGIDFENLDMEPSDVFLLRFNGLVRDYVRMGIL